MDTSHSLNHSGVCIDSQELRASYRNDIPTFYNKEWVLDKLFKLAANLDTGSGALSQDDAVLDALTQKIRANCAKALEAIDGAQNSRRDEDAVIQSSLCTLFQAIEEAVANGRYCRTRQYFRRFVLKAAESAEVKPDFVLADVPGSDDGLLVTSPPGKLDSLTLAHAFIQVEGKAAYFPVAAPENLLHKEDVRMTLVRGSDYARLIRAARPLITHVFGIFFCGNSFSVAHFDHSGINISPQFFILPNDDTGLRHFIRVVLRMTVEMSPYELGCDPTYFLELPQTYCQAQFPSFTVTMGDVPGTREKPNTWVTVGKPLFSSRSFFGKGTSVWLAFNEDTHAPAVLKNLWRTTNRDSEHTIYQKIRERIGDEQVRGLATTTGGGDVYFKGEPLSVAAVRDSPVSLDPTETNRVLHRVSLSQVGKPLYDYTCLDELGIALLDALYAYEKLSSHAILHRDISIGNVMILVDAFYNDDPTLLDPGKRVEIHNRSKGNFGGLLIDFNYAEILNPLDPSPSPGDGWTGTPPFMASELLLSIWCQKPCHHTESHDLESFDWVALYAIYKHALGEVPTTHPLHESLAQEFTRLFTAVSTQSVLEKRALAFTLYGIRSLFTYTRTIARSKRLRGFLIAVWTDLKLTFEGHRIRLVERPFKKRRLDRPERKAYQYLREKYPNSPTAARAIGVFDTEDVEWDDSEAEDSDDEISGEREEEEHAEEFMQLDAFLVPGYKYEYQVQKVNILLGKYLV